MRAVLNRMLLIASTSYDNNARDVYNLAVEIINDIQDIYTHKHSMVGEDGPWRWVSSETEEIGELACEDKHLTMLSAFYLGSERRTIGLDIAKSNNKLRPTIALSIYPPDSKYVYSLRLVPDSRTNSWTIGRVDRFNVNEHDPYFMITFARQLLVQPPHRPLDCAEQDPATVTWRVDADTLACRAIIQTWIHNYDKHRIGGPASLTHVGSYENGLHCHSALRYITGEYMINGRAYVDRVIELEKENNLSLMSSAEKASFVLGG